MEAVASAQSGGLRYTPSMAWVTAQQGQSSVPARELGQSRTQSPSSLSSSTKGSFGAVPPHHHLLDETL